MHNLSASVRYPDATFKPCGFKLLYDKDQQEFWAVKENALLNVGQPQASTWISHIQLKFICRD
jgi:hypothetical protein